MKLRATPMPIATPTPLLPAPRAAATAPTIALMLDVLSATTSTLATFAVVVPTTLFSIEAVGLGRITLVDSDAPPATPTLIEVPSATESAAATDVTSIAAVSCAATVTAPVVATLGTLTMLAAVVVSMRLWASAIPSEIETLAADVVPEMLADAAIAIDLLAASSRAVTEIGAPAETVAVPDDEVLRIAASTTLAMSLKATAPVAPTPTAAALPPIATASAMP